MGTIKDYVLHDNTTESPKKRNGWRLFLWIAFVSLIVLLVVGEVMLRRAAPILKGRIIETLSTRFNSHVELDDLQVSLIKGLAVSGNGLRIFAPDDVVAAGAKDPIIAVRAIRVSYQSGRFVSQADPREGGACVKELAIQHTAQVWLIVRQNGKKPSGIAARSRFLWMRSCATIHGWSSARRNRTRIRRFSNSSILCCKNVGPNAPSHYDATLINAIPKGDIHAVGTFWAVGYGGAGRIQPVTGKYTFQHADLNTIKGIEAALCIPTGDFTGRLNRIEVQGIADVPDFTLDTASHPVPLHTQFSAIVDGTTGDTYLQPVNAKLGASEFSCQGAVVNIKGPWGTRSTSTSMFLQAEFRTFCNSPSRPSRRS